MRRTRGQVVLVVVFAVLTLNAWGQVVLVALGYSNDPLTLVALQALIGTAGAAASWGTWRAARWAPAAGAMYGMVTAVMLLALGPLLALEPEARRGLWAGAVGVLAFGLWSAWYIRRLVPIHKRITPTPSRAAS